MLRFMRGPILGLIGGLLWIIISVFWMSIFFLIAFIKLIVPIRYFRDGCSCMLEDIASSWIWTCTSFINYVLGVKWEIVGDVNLRMDAWYLVISNHRSWTDILAVMQALNKKIPFLKFFLKKELIYVPLLGFAWWALDYPFMKRYSKSVLKKKPHLRGKDVETTRKSCEKFKKMPISVMNFVEGTRFTPEKNKQTNAKFKHLLAPKAGGIAYTLQALGEHITEIIDVTIIYPTGVNSFWDLLCGRISNIKICLRTLPITPELIGDYQNDKQFRVTIQAWLNKLWHEKDALLAKELE
jgi:1-acyl-sn-glycerol-3-phosphate acyltransferase